MTLRLAELCSGYGGLGLGLSRRQSLRILGNGVVPQQAAAAIHLLATPARTPVLSPQGT